MPNNLSPIPGSAEEREAFVAIQQCFAQQFRDIFPYKDAPRTVLIVPSLSLDPEILSKVKGSVHYEERMLCMLMLLRLPRTRVIYVTSEPIDHCIVDYYLHLLPGITGYHAQQRLTLLSCFDGSPRPLTQKILERPRLMQRIREHIPAGEAAHIACFNVSELERTLSVQLNIPIYGCDPDLWYWGSKSGSRQVFREAGVPVPDGFENLRSEADCIEALVALKERNPWLRKAVVKVNDGFSGDGNGIFSYDRVPSGIPLREWLQEHLHSQLHLVASGLGYDTFMEKFSTMEGIVEAFVDGHPKTSPSVQCRINPLGHTDIISTHDQLLGGESGQVYLGAYFPAHPDYAVEIGQLGKQVAEVLKEKGVLGRFAIDFISVKEPEGWKHYAIEINLRKGGTTHPYLMLQFLTDGEYDAERGLYLMPNGTSRAYFASDNLSQEHYKGLTPHDLIDIAMLHGLHYNGNLEEGVMFHLIGALSEFGKLGVVCIGSTHERAQMYFDQTTRVLDNETQHSKLQPAFE